MGAHKQSWVHGPIEGIQQGRFELTEPAGLFMAKVDVSIIPMVELQASLPAFERLLLAHGYGIYCTLHTGFLGGSRQGDACGTPLRF